MTAPDISPADRLLIEAMDALIGKRLTEAREMLPGRAARRLLLELYEAGLATVPQDHESPDLVLTLMGITVSCSAGPVGLLRTWQSAARMILAGEDAVHSGALRLKEGTQT